MCARQGGESLFQRCGKWLRGCRAMSRTNVNVAVCPYVDAPGRERAPESQELRRNWILIPNPLSDRCRVLNFHALHLHWNLHARFCTASSSRSNVCRFAHDRHERSYKHSLEILHHGTHARQSQHNAFAVPTERRRLAMNALYELPNFRN